MDAMVCEPKLSRAERKNRKTAYEQYLMSVLTSAKRSPSPLETRLEALENGAYVSKEKESGGSQEMRSFFEKTSVKKHSRNRRLFTKIVLHLERLGCDEFLSSGAHVNALHYIALHKTAWVKDPLEWKRSHYNVDRQLFDFVAHCFAKYRVPAFLDKSWLEFGDLNRALYVWIGAGKNVRHWPGSALKLTKKMAHYFIKAPAYLDITAAFRWAQVVGMTGSPKTASRVLRTALSYNNCDRMPLSDALLRLCIDNPNVSANTFDEVMDFVNFRLGDDREFSLAGRSMAALIRLSHDWHAEHNNVDRERFRHYKWSASGINGFFFEKQNGDDSDGYYFIEELCNSVGLMYEGDKMHNCVFTYASLCKNKQCSIFTLRALINGQEKRLGTIEVTLENYTIVQAKAKNNRELQKAALEVLKKWAKAASLKLSTHVIN
jgi:hypothetical protein